MWNYFDNIRLIILFTSDILCFKQSWELMPQRWLKLTKCQNPYFSQKLFPFSYSNSWNPSSIQMKCVHLNTHVQFPFIYLRGFGGNVDSQYMPHHHLCKQAPLCSWPGLCSIKSILTFHNAPSIWTGISIKIHLTRKFPT